MSLQNRYKIWCEYIDEGCWKTWPWPGDTWQDAIHTWIKDCWFRGQDRDIAYQVVSEKPSKGGRSGMMEITGSLVVADS